MLESVGSVMSNKYVDPFFKENERIVESYDVYSFVMMCIEQNKLVKAV